MFKRFLALPLLVVSATAADPNTNTTPYIVDHVTVTQNFFAHIKQCNALLPHLRISTISTIFEPSYRYTQFLLISQQQLDICLAAVKQLIQEQEYQTATMGLEVIILSSIESSLPPMPKEKFEDYKQTYISLVSTCGLHNGPTESDLYLTADKIIEFIEKQQNPAEAKRFMQVLIQEAMKAPRHDILITMLETWRKFHVLRGSPAEGVAYIVDVFRQLAMNPNLHDVLFCSNDLAILLDYADVLGKDLVIEACRTIIDLFFEHTFSALSKVSDQQKIDLLLHVESILAQSSSRNDEYIINLRNAYRDGIPGLIRLCQRKLAQDIKDYSYQLADLMKPKERQMFLHHIHNNLQKKGFRMGALNLLGLPYIYY